MSNLHRHLAPISEAAWEQIDDQAAVAFKRAIAGRRVVDMPEPRGSEFSALTTGHIASVDGADVPGVELHRRESLPVIEVRVPFSVTRSAVDDVDRGSVDSDWDPVVDAAQRIARVEDRTLFEGGAGLEGIATASDNEPVALPERVEELPDAVAKATSELRLAGVGGPYYLLLPADLYTQVSETVDHGYPVFDHVLRQLRDGHIVWAPALQTPIVLSGRGGDYELHLGEDVSIGYLSHDADHVHLYLQETFTVRIATAEASVVLRR